MLTIRRARQEDCDSIARVHHAAVTGIHTTLYTPEEIQSWATPKKPESYEESIRSKEFFVAEDDGLVIGFAILKPENGEVEAVYVSPEAGGRGVGLALLRQMDEQARAHRLSVLHLYASLNAVPFYKRAGYVAQEQSKYRLSTGVEIACVPMTRTIEPGELAAN